MEKELEAKVSEEQREKFGEDYSSNLENIKKFIEIGLEKIIEKLPNHLDVLDLGGAGGRLAESVKNELEKKRGMLYLLSLIATKSLLRKRKKGD